MSLRNETPKDGSQGSEKDRRAARKANAQNRQRLAPLRKQVKATERKLSRLQPGQARIAQALTDPKLYQDSPDRVAALNQQRAQTDKAVAEAEVEWLAAEEELENASGEAA
jgi:ATP-binding cassette subfamily F protein 3